MKIDVTRDSAAPLGSLQIVRDLAAMDPEETDQCRCFFCGRTYDQDNREIEHTEECLWVRATGCLAGLLATNERMKGRADGNG